MTGKSDFMICIGHGFYPTLDLFVAESKTRGVCRRLSRIPDDMNVGSRVFMIYRGKIFGFFEVDSFEIILPDGVELPGTLKVRGMKIVTTSQALAEPMRGCGHRMHVGASYVVSGTLEMFNEPYSEYTGKQFRGYKRVEGDHLMKLVSGGMVNNKVRPEHTTMYLDDQIPQKSTSAEAIDNLLASLATIRR